MDLKERIEKTINLTRRSICAISMNEKLEMITERLKELNRDTQVMLMGNGNQWYCEADGRMWSCGIGECGGELETQLCNTPEKAVNVMLRMVNEARPYVPPAPPKPTMASRLADALHAISDEEREQLDKDIKDAKARGMQNCPTELFATYHLDGTVTYPEDRKD